ncbi:hypothetical protein H6G74_19665 [Nostoc spongiaeforme FACHB-130]|uniref:Uncharacterized protein n=1 Tax=Nostoc spongiaeforme FACHB-130 TaxID=1357510 RepID=A0ABR8FZY6_9NOSO|nr:hypothetical protein [Nostoc spongiaeforme]MBD2596533.1 hypothetical protein [Nostoc spongiaeforme FACHB-130]
MLEKFSSNDEELYTDIIDENGRLITVPLGYALKLTEKRAIAEDKFLEIKRNKAPVHFIPLPDVPEAQDFLRLSYAIKNVAVFDIGSVNDDQALMMRCIQFYWQSKAGLLPNMIYKLIPDSSMLEDNLSKLMPPTALENLKIEVAADKALYDLLKYDLFDPETSGIKASSVIKKWTDAKGITFPFSNFEELFVTILKQSFQNYIQDEMFRSNFSGYDKKTLRRNYRQFIKLITDCIEDKLKVKESENILFEMGWQGYPILAFWESSHQNNSKEFIRLWKQYIKTHRALIKLIDSRLYWKNCIPHQKRKRTSNKEPIQGVLTEDGYIHWVWC